MGEEAGSGTMEPETGIVLPEEYVGVGLAWGIAVDRAADTCWALRDVATTHSLSCTWTWRCIYMSDCQRMVDDDG